MKYTNDQLRARQMFRWAEDRAYDLGKILGANVEVCDRSHIHQCLDRVIDDIIRTRAKALQLFPGVEQDLYPEDRK